MRVAFKKGKLGGLFDHVIDDLTCGPYCHVELEIERGSGENACFSSRSPRGVSIESVDIDTDGWDIVFLPRRDVYNKIDLLTGFAWGSTGKTYDYADLLEALRGHGPELSPTQRFCSGVVAEALSNVGLVKLAQPFWTISPNRLYSILKSQYPQ